MSSIVVYERRRRNELARVAGAIGIVLGGCFPRSALADEPAASVPHEGPVQHALDENNTAGADTSNGETLRPQNPAGVDSRDPATNPAPDPLAWRWPRYQALDLVLLAEQATIALGTQYLPKNPRWTSQNAFDEAARDAFRIEDEGPRRAARTASDVGLAILGAQLAVDPAFVAGWHYGEGETALEMALLDAEVMSFSVAVTSLTSALVGRERPYARDLCESGPGVDAKECTGKNRYRSYFSGHTNGAFTMAALTCTHHLHLPLYGGGAADAAPCALSLATAAGVGMLRMAADQHYLSDVLTGAGFGLASGFGLPYLLRYAWPVDPDLGRAVGVTQLHLTPTPGGLGVGGVF